MKAYKYMQMVSKLETIIQKEQRDSGSPIAENDVA